MENQTNTGQTPPPGAQAQSTLPGLEGFFDTYLRIKAPFQLPTGLKEFIVKYGPWITLVILVIAVAVTIPLLLVAIGITTLGLPFAATGGVSNIGAMGYVQLSLGIVALVLELMAIPALLKRQLKGWHYAYYASLVTAFSSLISLEIFSLLFGLLISMYVLFQIREYYK